MRRMIIVALLCALSYAQTEEEVSGYENVSGQYTKTTINGDKRFTVEDDDFERVDEDGLIIFGEEAVLVPNGAIVHGSGRVYYPQIWPEWKVLDWDNKWALGSKGSHECTHQSVWIRNTYDKAEQQCIMASTDMGMTQDFSTFGQDLEGRNPVCWYEAGSKVARFDGGYWKNPNARLICRVVHEFVYPTKAPTEKLEWCSCYSYTKTWIDDVAYPPETGTIMCQMRHSGSPQKSCRPADEERYAESGCPQMMCRFRVPPPRRRRHLEELAMLGEEFDDDELL